MKQELINNIIQRWKLTDAFCKGVSTNEDKELWENICSKSSFQTNFSHYTSIDKTYLGVLDNVNYFTENCSVEGLMNYIQFYEQQTGILWKELYQSNINSYQPKHKTQKEETNWWQPHLKLFGQFI